MRRTMMAVATLAMLAGAGREARAGGAGEACLVYPAEACVRVSGLFLPGYLIRNTVTLTLAPITGVRITDITFHSYTGPTSFEDPFGAALRSQLTDPAGELSVDLITEERFIPGVGPEGPFQWYSFGYQLDDGTVGTINVTPEPATLALLATGLLGLGGVAMRRRVSRLG